ncbi:MAG TPA: Hsp20/alpha crystallin family protein [Phycisphaerae bacterium]|jgi:HSP20 family protein|nr:Hsp20/alpha crystallin family protein [Phycisphaerae bacterium]HOB73973.1 Hsp20/alpha crystallin family protein [Phycisphaerae bacterium]HOJ55361.1 Hsp20/alpha crystallin family protein [Phycisphaerae bacterium]HOL25114.1 Hsp20/alpha crystallin family protein [Phycisphaerae bacterium]HPP19710.1 Hsp20/alpha crystallin family protein [Phycisphaerae bacterium]
MSLPSLRREIDEMFDRFLRDPFGATGLAEMFGGWTSGLRTDLSESDDEVVVRVELPGVEARDVDINVTGDMLTISGEKKEEHEEKQRNYHYVERQFGKFHRSIQLPGYVDPDKVDASFKNGVLTVKIAKRPDAKPRRIEVKTG